MKTKILKLALLSGVLIFAGTLYTAIWKTPTAFINAIPQIIKNADAAITVAEQAAPLTSDIITAMTNKLPSSATSFQASQSANIALLDAATQQKLVVLQSRISQLIGMAPDAASKKLLQTALTNFSNIFISTDPRSLNAIAAVAPSSLAQLQYALAGLQQSGLPGTAAFISSVVAKNPAVQSAITQATNVVSIAAEKKLPSDTPGSGELIDLNDGQNDGTTAGIADAKAEAGQKTAAALKNPARSDLYNSAFSDAYYSAFTGTAAGKTDVSDPAITSPMLKVDDAIFNTAYQNVYYVAARGTLDGARLGAMNGAQSPPNEAFVPPQKPAYPDYNQALAAAYNVAFEGAKKGTSDASNRNIASASPSYASASVSDNYKAAYNNTFYKPARGFGDGIEAGMNDGSKVAAPAGGGTIPDITPDKVPLPTTVATPINSDVKDAYITQYKNAYVRAYNNKILQTNSTKAVENAQQAATNKGDIEGSIRGINDGDMLTTAAAQKPRNNPSDLKHPDNAEYQSAGANQSDYKNAYMTAYDRKFYNTRGSMDGNNDGSKGISPKDYHGFDKKPDGTDNPDYTTIYDQAYEPTKKIFDETKAAEQKAIDDKKMSDFNGGAAAGLQAGTASGIQQAVVNAVTADIKIPAGQPVGQAAGSDYVLGYTASYPQACQGAFAGTHAGAPKGTSDFAAGQNNPTTFPALANADPNYQKAYTKAYTEAYTAAQTAANQAKQAADAAAQQQAVAAAAKAQADAQAKTAAQNQGTIDGTTDGKNPGMSAKTKAPGAYTENNLDYMTAYNNAFYTGERGNSDGAAAVKSTTAILPIAPTNLPIGMQQADYQAYQDRYNAAAVNAFYTAARGTIDGASAAVIPGAPAEPVIDQTRPQVYRDAYTTVYKTTFAKNIFLAKNIITKRQLVNLGLLDTKAGQPPVDDYTRGICLRIFELQASNQADADALTAFMTTNLPTIKGAIDTKMADANYLQTLLDFLIKHPNLQAFRDTNKGAYNTAFTQDLKKAALVSGRQDRIKNALQNYVNKPFDGSSKYTQIPAGQSGLSVLTGEQLSLLPGTFWNGHKADVLKDIPQWTLDGLSDVQKAALITALNSTNNTTKAAINANQMSPLSKFCSSNNIK